MGSFDITIGDRSREKSNLKVNVGVVTAVTLPDQLTWTGQLRDAIAAMSYGAILKNKMTVFDEILTTSWPTSPWANRETKFLVRYRDTTEYFDAPTNSIKNEGFGHVHQFEIPCAKLDLSGLLVAGSDFVNLAQTQVAAFVTLFNANVLSPSNGSVAVESIEIVGRNL